ncbi:alkaline phosphatase family protein [Mucilaginibacter auburnensis]|uniref:Putative AlkP superfamily pyrophosphatase or phosphodiesterase n=1 Tax=Mucilaginibacter auburnensis TaxID=1457233 RepID=A0A2H9VLZ7_9SPHI|nr:nucleotide pyrophosphatase/phosphodiesterase family protein [Mucilaginibacter auburnensis]PJJ79358.1 putative AlkP superfamily pyrophosphatase or phosphodiesterase [Mucilaginibacter auburnensis]
MKNVKNIALALVILATGASAQAQQQKKELKTLIVFFDGLRPDYITPEAMPNLYAFKKAGAFGKQHHSVFPTVTRVNSSAYSTGSYPAKTGILGNTVYFPEVDKTKGLNTGEAYDLKRIDSATNGHLLTTISLGEVLQNAGKKMMVFSSGSTGQALLQNHTVSGGAIVNSSMILPESYKETVFSAVGPFPKNDKSPAKHVWVTDALIKLGLSPDGPAVSAIWFSDPDGTAHSDGIGTVTAMASIKTVDEQFGRIINYLKSQKLDEVYNVIISTDHGFVTHVGKTSIANYLIEKGLKKDKTSQDVVVAEGAIYVKDHNPDVIKKIVATLQQPEFIGAIFTKGAKPGDMKGWVDGTISFEAIHWNHPTRAADILVDENWDNRKNQFGYEGTGFSGGVAGHGGFSPYEVHIALIASGPSFKKSFEGDLPTANVDITPTVLHLAGLQAPEVMDGRVIYELLNEKAPASTPQKAKVENIQSSVKTPWGSYKLTLQRTILGKYAYTDFTKTERVINTPSK